MDVDKSEIIQLLQVDYSELIQASSVTESGHANIIEASTLKNKCMESIMEALGPKGPGLLSITGVHNVEALRSTLLPLARKLALMADADRRRILKDHCLGTDVPLKNPDRSVSSFAAQLNFGQNFITKLEHANVLPRGDICYQQNPGLPLENKLGSKVVEQEYSEAGILQGFHHDDFEQLGNSFKQLGFCMVEVGLLLAQICDRAIGGIELKQAIMDSCTAKGRLIHYHSLSENVVLMNAVNTKKTKGKHSVMNLGLPSRCGNSRTCLSMSREKSLNGKGYFPVTEKNASLHKQTGTMLDSLKKCLWQQWHYDYGIFTLLNAPMFLSSLKQPTRDIGNGYFEMNQAAQECSSPNGHTYLKILNAANGRVMFASAPSSSLIVQVGEAAQILSGGKLRATAHCVCRPAERTDVSRETFVVFLQPAWNKCLCLPKWLCRERMAAKTDFEDIPANPSTDMMQSSELSTFMSSPLSYNELESSSKIARQKSDESNEVANGDLKSLNVLIDEIQKIVPPLMSRWKEGQTFAEFSRETTRQYYGADGMQSQR
eukprot:Gb_36428 [translate_table: standard]